MPGKRLQEGRQNPATVKVSVEVENPTGQAVSGTLQYQIAGKLIKQSATITANKTTTVKLPDLQLENPKLWWPSGYGAQNLYDLKIEFVAANQVLDQEQLKVGVRQIDNVWNEHTKSMGAFVNGQKFLLKEVTGSFLMRCYALVMPAMMQKSATTKI